MNTKLINAKASILSGAFLFDRKLAICLWFGLSILAIFLNYLHNDYNNFIIFRHVFYHALKHANLYLPYPEEYNDVNLYGPVFSVLIAPFALLPKALGLAAWVLFNTTFLYLAIRQLPLEEKYQNAILILCAHEMMNAASWMQTNPFVGACIILGFTYTHKGKEVWALFFIMLATMVKLYGVVGFAFFFFSEKKGSFISWAILWGLVFFILPVPLANLQYIEQCYIDWYNALVVKSERNINLFIHNDYQDISVMGMIRRIFHWQDFKNIYITGPAVILFFAQYLKFKHFGDLRYRFYILCNVLIMTVIFTTSAESPTYIIAFPAVCIWFTIQPPSKNVNAFFIFCIILTSFSYSDLLTPYVREHIVRPYSLKALPCFVMWLVLLYQVFTEQYLAIDIRNGLRVKKILV